MISNSMRYQRRCRRKHYSEPIRVRRRYMYTSNNHHYVKRSTSNTFDNKSEKSQRFHIHRLQRTNEHLRGTIESMNKQLDGWERERSKLRTRIRRLYKRIKELEELFVLARVPVIVGKDLMSK